MITVTDVLIVLSRHDISVKTYCLNYNVHRNSTRGHQAIKTITTSLAAHLTIQWKGMLLCTFVNGQYF